MSPGELPQTRCRQRGARPDASRKLLSYRAGESFVLAACVLASPRACALATPQAAPPPNGDDGFAAVPPVAPTTCPVLWLVTIGRGLHCAIRPQVAERGAQRIQETRSRTSELRACVIRMHEAFASERPLPTAASIVRVAWANPSDEATGATVGGANRALAWANAIAPPHADPPAHTVDSAPTEPPEPPQLPSAPYAPRVQPPTTADGAHAAAAPARSSASTAAPHACQAWRQVTALAVASGGLSIACAAALAGPPRGPKQTALAAYYPTAQPALTHAHVSDMAVCGTSPTTRQRAPGEHCPGARGACSAAAAERWRGCAARHHLGRPRVVAAQTTTALGGRSAARSRARTSHLRARLNCAPWKYSSCAPCS